MAEMNDREISEAVCKALGISPRLEWAVGPDENSIRIQFTREAAAIKWLDEKKAGGLHADCNVYPLAVYLSVLDWRGFGQVVERLRERNMPFTMQHFTDPYPNRYGVRVNYMKTCHADTLPRALALAVLAWEASR